MIVFEDSLAHDKTWAAFGDSNHLNLHIEWRTEEEIIKVGKRIGVRYFVRTKGRGWHPNIDSASRRLVFIIAYVCSQLCFRAMDAECMWNEPDTPYTFSLYMSMNGAHVIPWNHFVLRRIYSQSQYWGITCIGRTNDNEGCWFTLTIAYLRSVLCNQSLSLLYVGGGHGRFPVQGVSIKLRLQGKIGYGEMRFLSWMRVQLLDALKDNWKEQKWIEGSVSCFLRIGG